MKQPKWKMLENPTPAGPHPITSTWVVESIQIEKNSTPGKTTAKFMKIEVNRGFYSTLAPACSAGVLFRWVNVRRSRSVIQLAMVDSELEWTVREGAGKYEVISIAPPPPLSFLLTDAHPLDTNFFSPQRSAAVKIKDVSSNFHQEYT